MAMKSIQEWQKVFKMSVNRENSDMTHNIYLILI